jgi:hypothetical protein
MAKTKSVKGRKESKEIELMAAKQLLRRWIKKYAPRNKPGAWDYDHDAVDLIETSAILLGIKEEVWENL